MTHSASKLGKPQAQQVLSWLVASLILGSPIGLATAPAFGLDVLPSVTRVAPEPASIAAIRRDLAQRFSITSKITLVSFSDQTWPDGCLGLPRGQEACTQALVPGWRVEVSDGLQTWIYHTDKTGSLLRLASPDLTSVPPRLAVLPQPVAQALIRQVARDTSTNARKLRIAAVKPANFDGCLGIYRPGQACTKNLISGYQAIVISADRTFVYHLNTTGTRIAQNSTASGARRAVRVSFEPLGEAGKPGANVVFQSGTSGDLMGRMSMVILTEDGQITQYQSSPTARFRPVVLKTLTPAQLNAFKQVLQNRRFRNLNGLSYLTSAALADYPTTTYQTPDSTTQLIDLEKQSLPRSLQQVMNSWDALIQPAKNTGAGA
jgi:hypothetical protein